jgi:hypothetical protein
MKPPKFNPAALPGQRLTDLPTERFYELRKLFDWGWQVRRQGGRWGASFHTRRG